MSLIYILSWLDIRLHGAYDDRWPLLLLRGRHQAVSSITFYYSYYYLRRDIELRRTPMFYEDRDKAAAIECRTRILPAAHALIYARTISSMRAFGSNLLGLLLIFSQLAVRALVRKSTKYNTTIALRDCMRDFAIFFPASAVRPIARRRAERAAERAS